MSVVGGSEKRPAAVLYVGAFLMATAIAAGAYVLLVVRERVYTEKQQAQLKHLEEEMRKADDYLKRHPNPQSQRDVVNAVAEDLKKRVPYGPMDLQVGSYIDTAAQQANIGGVHWTVQGGLKVPRNDVDKRTPTQRLSLEVPKLKSSIINVDFSGRYKDALAMLRLLSQSPYPLEIFNIEMRRDQKSLNISVVLKMRYLYE